VRQVVTGNVAIRRQFDRRGVANRRYPLASHSGHTVLRRPGNGHTLSRRHRTPHQGAQIAP
jgi:hypothetical protein